MKILAGITIILREIWEINPFPYSIIGCKIRGSEKKGSLDW